MIAVAEILHGEDFTFTTAELQAQVIFGVIWTGEEVSLIRHPGLEDLQGTSNDFTHGFSTPSEMMCDNSGGTTRKMPVPESFTMATSS